MLFNKVEVALIFATLTFWVLSLFSNIDLNKLSYNISIFQAMNPFFWIAIVFLVILLFYAVVKEEAQTLTIVILLTIILVSVPYLIGFGRSHDSYQQLGFALYIKDTGHSVTGLSDISGWPGFHILSAIIILLTGVEPAFLVKLFPFVNLVMFSLGLFILTRILFRDSIKSLFAILFTLLASNVFFFDYQMNWFTFSLIPLFISTLLVLGPKKNLLSIIIFFFMTISHSINPIVCVFVLFAMSFFNFNLRKNRPVIYSCALIYLGWTLYSGTYLITAVTTAINKTNLSQSAGILQATAQNVLIPQNIPQLFNRIVLAALLVTLFVILVRKNSRKIYMSLAFPVILIIALSYFFPLLTSGFTSLAFKFLPVAYLLGLPLVSSQLKDSLLGSWKPNRFLGCFNKRKIRKMFLFICFCALLVGFTFSSYEKEKFYAVTATNLDSANFVSTSFHQDKINILWSGSLLELYYVMPTNMTNIEPVSSSEYNLGIQPDIAVVDYGWFDPVVASEHAITSDDLLVLNHVINNFNLIYSDGGYSDIYSPVR